MAYKKKDFEKKQNELSGKVVENKHEENLNEISDKVIEAKSEENLSEKVEIVKNGVTRIRMRSEVPGYIAQGWKLK
jgi:membrane-bound ClpP family serine protease